MLHKAFNPQDSNNLHGRCQHRSTQGRQCRTPLTAAHATLCPRHAAALRDDSVDLSALLASEVPEKKSAADIHSQLWNLSLALQQGRISPRRAAVLAYIHSLLLRTLPAIAKQESGDDDEGLDMTGAPRPRREPRIVIDMTRFPRPIRNKPPAQPDSIPDQPMTYPTPNSSADSAPPILKLYGFHPTTPSGSAEGSAPRSAVPAVTAAVTLPDPGRRLALDRINNVPPPAAKYQSPSSQTVPVPPLPPLLPLPPQTPLNQTQFLPHRPWFAAPRCVILKTSVERIFPLGLLCRGVAQPG